MIYQGFLSKELESKMPHRDYFRMLARKRREQELEEDGDYPTEDQCRVREEEAAEDAHSQYMIDSDWINQKQF